MFGSKEKTRECPSCALEAPVDAETCPFCGYEFPQQQKGTTIMAWLFVALIVLWVITRL
ncbi:zinc ribbon domain-containing protein [Balneolales bacterium ANBcel1]|nr:zinc ribbon domain-containing protein [Balneolales bacterium ANBcel1]